MGVCSVINCSTYNRRDCVSYHRIPAILTHGTDEINELSKRRRAAWIDAISRDDFSDIKHGRVCSKHFISGKPSKLEDVSNPDWVPNQRMGHIINGSHLRSAVDLDRYHGERKELKVHSVQEDSFASSASVEVQKREQNYMIVKLIEGTPVSVGKDAMPTNFSCHPHEEKPPAPRRLLASKNGDAVLLLVRGPELSSCDTSKQAQLIRERLTSFTSDVGHISNNSMHDSKCLMKDSSTMSTCNSKTCAKMKKRDETLKRKHEDASLNGEMFPFNHSWKRNIPYSLNRHIARETTNSKVELWRLKDDSENHYLYPKRLISTIKSSEQFDLMLNGQYLWGDRSNELTEHDYAKVESGDSLVLDCNVGDFLEVKIEVDSEDDNKLE